MHFLRSKQLLLQNSERIRLLVQGVSAEQAQWKPAPNSWSILEVVNHLLDEEREDFRMRLDIILHEPDRKLPPIDPERWVVERKYNDRDLEESLELFLSERQASFEWLETIGEPEWEASYQMPFGSIRAGDMFASWVAHDLLHMRQLVELHRAYVLELVAPFEVTYAGPW
ncbi:MAG TPA: DinB family protein [Chloroflexi bacterium]|nr:DinB family protein [Chloroflexota bacterium]